MFNSKLFDEFNRLLRKTINKLVQGASSKCILAVSRFEVIKHWAGVRGAQRQHGEDLRCIKDFVLDVAVISIILINLMRKGNWTALREDRGRRWSMSHYN